MLLVALLRVVQPEAPSWAQAVVALSPLLFGEFDVFAAADLTFLGVYQDNLLFSPTFTYGLPIFLSLVLLTSHVVSKERRQPTAGVFVAAAVLAAGATGAKVTVLPTMLLALPLTLVIVAARGGGRPPVRPTIGLLASFALAFVATAPFIYQSTGGGALELVPLGTIRRLAAAGTLPPTALGVVIGLVGTLPILVMVALVPRKVWQQTAGLLLACCATVAIGGFLLFDHPGYSQFYILAYGITAAFPLAVAGVIRLVNSLDRHGVGAGIWLPAVGTPLVVGVLMTWRVPQTPVVVAMITTTVASSVAVFVSLLRHSGCGGRRAWRMFAGISLAVTVTVGSGLDFPLDAAADLSNANPAASPMTPDAVTASHLDLSEWAREATGPDDLLAVDVHHRAPRDARFFTMSALTERRVYIESWAYAPAAFSSDSGLPTVIRERLTRNEDGFAGDAAALGHLRRAGVTHLVHDRRFGYGQAASLAERLPVAFENERFLVLSLSDVP